MFKVIYGVLYLVMAIVRKTGTSKYRGEPVKNRVSGLMDIIILVVAGWAMILPLLYIFTNWFDCADYFLPDWVSYLGVFLYIVSIWLLWRSHYDLGRNWVENLAIRKDHKLITTGVFKYIRHPMYGAHIYWGIAQILILHNFVVGPSILIAFLFVYLYRVKKEEKMMVKEFGTEYKEYMKKTGRIFPKINISK
jgi:protein-S-isoprenylcysteine O-methyltransferase Ste14